MLQLQQGSKHFMSSTCIIAGIEPQLETFLGLNEQNLLVRPQKDQAEEHKWIME